MGTDTTQNLFQARWIRQEYDELIYNRFRKDHSDDKQVNNQASGGLSLQIGGNRTAFTSVTMVISLENLSHVPRHMPQLRSRWGIGLDIEVFSDHLCPLPSGKEIVADHEVAIIDVNCDWNCTLIHNIPLVVAC